MHHIKKKKTADEHEPIARGQKLAQGHLQRTNPNQ
jgi:hypothetical protein